MKKSIKKLSLSKMTISNLNEAEMIQKLGGLKKSDIFCGPPGSLASCTVAPCSTRVSCPVKY